MANIDQPNTGSSTDHSGSDLHGSMSPYESLISQIVARIKNEPFLFVIAIAALLIGFAITAAGIGSTDLRFIVIVIAVLTSITIFGYYFLASRRLGVSRERGKYSNEDRAGETDQLVKKPAGQSMAISPQRADQPASKYNISAPNANIGAIGDQHKFTQYINTQATDAQPGDSPEGDEEPAA